MSKRGEKIYKHKDGRWEGRYIKSRGQDGQVKYGYVYASNYKTVRNKLIEKNTFTMSIATPPKSIQEL